VTMEENTAEAKEESLRQQALLRVSEARHEVTEEKAAAQAEEAAATHSENLLESEVQRLQLQIQSHIHPASLQPHARGGMLSEAWTGQLIDETTTQTPNVPPSLPCLAVFSENGIHFTAMQLTREGALGREMVIKPGSHAFVKLHNEKFIRVALKSASFGAACGHPQLARETPVLYAGEMDFDENGILLRWSNVSGTYRFADKFAFQTGLRLDIFWALQSSDEPMSSINEEHSLTTPDGLILYRVLATTDEEYADVQETWAAALLAFRTENEVAGAAFENLQGMMRQRCEAIVKYGYLMKLQDYT